MPSVDRKLSARKKPSQDRSQKMVAKILLATRRLLTEAGRANSLRITTNRIAEEAGISVGSLYQYFPNTEAILYEMYQEMLAQIQHLLDEFDSTNYLSLPREAFFDKLNRRMTSSGPDSEFVFAMHNATRIYPMLNEADRKHAEVIASHIASFLKHYGSTWPRSKLRRLALFAYYSDYGIWMYRDHARPPRKEVFDWELNVLNSILLSCFDD